MFLKHHPSGFTPDWHTGSSGRTERVPDDRPVGYFYTRSDNAGEIDRLPNDVLQSGVATDKETSSRGRALAADTGDNSRARSSLCASPTRGIWNGAASIPTDKRFVLGRGTSGFSPFNQLS